VGTGERRLKRVIVTADDFGISTPVNEAIEDAYRHGILTTTCLMVGAPAADDAVRRAKQIPKMGVGLHLVIVCGRPILPASQVPDLVDALGRFDTNLFRAGVRYFFLPHVRRQLAREIRAQFEAFSKTGLSLDHVNAHKHLHIHPTVFSMILRIGKDYGLRAIRIPFEPLPPQGKVSVAEHFVGMWISLMRRRAARYEIRVNDRMYGLRDTGRMNLERLKPILESLPYGVSEVVCHPATGRWPEIEDAAYDYQFEEEYRALLHDDVRSAVKDADLISFRDIP
jgi:hopanoid biosynthesis associated protein HpnK